MARTAMVTCNVWPYWFQQLEKTAEPSLSLDQWARDKVSPDFWDSPPIAESLRHAFLGYPGDRKWETGAKNAIKEIYRDCPVRMSDNKINIPTGVKVQSVCYNHLIQTAFQSSALDSDLGTHIINLFPLHVVDRSFFDMTLWVSLLSQLRKHEALRVIKTWMNAWATTSRISKEQVKLPCLFGCEQAKDRMIHYVQCPRLFGAMSCLVPGDIIPPCPLQRLGIKNTSVEILKYQACAFAGYHAIRRAAASWGLTEAALTVTQSEKALSIFADYFCHEAHSLGIAHISRTELGASTGLFWTYSVSGICATLPPVTWTEVVSVDGPPRDGLENSSVQHLV